MTRRLRFHKSVWTELGHTSSWYEKQRQGLGEEFVELVMRTLDEIREAPERWPLWRDDRRYRRRVLQRFPFSIFYSFDSDQVLIVAVAHDKRKPGYWLR